MAMVVTNPSGQFKTSCPSSFLFSSPPCRRLLGSKIASSIPCASSSTYFFPRRNLHIQRSRNDPSISTTNFGSSNLFPRPVSIDVPLPVFCKRMCGYLWVRCLASVASVNQSNPTSSLPQSLLYDPALDYEDRKNTSTNPEHSLELWIQESKKLKQTKLDENEKRRQLELKTSHGIEDNDNNSKGSEDGSYYVGQSFSGSSACSLELDTVEVNGQSEP